MRPYQQPQDDVETLVKDHLGLVRKIAWHVYGRVHSSIEVEDLIQIGYVGLITSAQKYSPQEGASFAGYASMRIRGAMVDHLRKSSNLCRTTILMRKRFQKAEETLTAKLGRLPYNDEMSEHMQLDMPELLEWQHAFAANVHDSLDDVYDDFSIIFADGKDSPEEQLSDKDLRNMLREALTTLPEKEALVIQLFYVEELNVYEIAEVLEVTSGRVSQIKKSAVRRLREAIEERQAQEMF
jgi:RNA polymerase sigma factor for flagellar operon FliA